MHRFRYCAFVSILCGASLQVGCSAATNGAPYDDEPARGGSTVAEVSQASAAFAPGTWTPFTMPVPLCFKKHVTDSTSAQFLTDAEYAIVKQKTLTILNQGWGMAPGVTFQNKGECPITGSLTIALYKQAGSGGFCSSGVGGVCEFGGDPSGPSTYLPPDLIRIVIHEVGHGLGLAHEHQRSDAPVLCPASQTQLNASQSCIASSNSSGTCSAADINNAACDYVLGDQKAALGGCPATHSIPVPANGAIYNRIKATIDNLVADSSYQRLTVYDPLSVMNDCRDANGAVGYWPTQLDLLGMRILYPNSPSTHHLGCKNACFYTGTGSVVVGTAGTLVSDWTALGARNISPTWTVGSWSGAGETIISSHIASGAVSFRYNDGAGRAHSGSGSVLKSDGMYSAVLQTTASVALL